MTMNFVEDSPVEVLVAAETVYAKLSRWITAVGVFLLPLFFLPWTTSVVEFNKQALLVVVAGLGMVLWLLDVVMSGHLSWRANPLDKGVLAVWGASALATVFSLTKFKSIFGLSGSLSGAFVTVTALTILYFLVVNLFHDKGRLVRTLFAGSLSLTFLIGILQLFGVHLFKFLNTVGSVNALGMLAAMTLPLLHRTNISVFKYLNIGKVGTVLAFVMLVIVNWWVLWTVAIVGMVAMIVFESLETSRFRMSKFLFPMSTIVLGVFLLIANLNLPFLKNNLPVEVSPSYNLSNKVLMGVLKENFIFGYGPENFSIAFDKYGAGDLKDTTLSNVKLFNAAAQMYNSIVDGGVAAILGFGFLFWLIATMLWRLWRSRQGLDPGSVGVISALVASVAALFFYPFNITLFFTWYVLLALTMLALLGKQRAVFNVEEKASLSLASSLGFIGGLILTLVGFYFGSLIYAGDVKYASALSRTSAKDAASDVVAAINWNGRDDRYYRFASQAALGLLSEELSKKADGKDTQKNARIQNYVSSAVNLAQQATQIAPYESSNWANLGSVYGNLISILGGADSLAESAYSQAEKLRPGDPNYNNQVGMIYLSKADILRQLAASGGQNTQQFNEMAVSALSRSEDNLKKAVETSGNFGLAIYNLGSVYEREGRLSEAIGQLEKIIPFNSDQPGLTFELGLLYYRNNQKDKAFTQLQQSVLLSPNFANAHWYLALIYEERNDVPNAIDQLEKILATDANKDNQTVISKLNSLKSGKKQIPPAKITDQKPLQ